MSQLTGAYIKLESLGKKKSKSAKRQASESSEQQKVNFLIII